MPKNYTYVIVRQDLHPSQQAVQACHACMAATKQFPWQGEHPFLVLVGVPDEAALEEWYQTISKDSFEVTAFREPDLENSLTAVAATNVVGKHRRVFSSLPLVKLGGNHVNS